MPNPYSKRQAKTGGGYLSRGGNILFGAFREITKPLPKTAKASDKVGLKTALFGSIPKSVQQGGEKRYTGFSHKKYRTQKDIEQLSAGLRLDKHRKKGVEFDLKRFARGKNEGGKYFTARKLESAVKEFGQVHGQKAADTFRERIAPYVEKGRSVTADKVMQIASLDIKQKEQRHHLQSIIGRMTGKQQTGMQGQYLVEKDLPEAIEIIRKNWGDPAAAAVEKEFGVEAVQSEQEKKAFAVPEHVRRRRAIAARLSSRFRRTGAGQSYRRGSVLRMRDFKKSSKDMDSAIRDDAVGQARPYFPAKQVHISGSARPGESLAPKSNVINFPSQAKSSGLGAGADKPLDKAA